MASFPRAKLCRFNEVAGCAPPPGTYQPILQDRPILGHFNRSERFVEPKTPAPPPGTYQPILLQKPILGHFDRSERFAQPKAPAPRPVCTDTPKPERRHSLDNSQGNNRTSPGLRRSHSVYNARTRTFLPSIKRRDKACSCNLNEPRVNMLPVAVMADLPCPNCAQAAQQLSKSMEDIKELEWQLKMQTERVVCEVAKSEAMNDLVIDLDNKVTDFDFELKEMLQTNVDLSSKLNNTQTDILTYRLQICSMADSIDELTAIRNEHLIQRSQLLEEIKYKDGEIALCQANVNMLMDNLSVEESKNIELRSKVEEISKERLASIESIQKFKVELMQEIKKKDDEIALCQAKVNQLKDNLSVEESKNIELAGKVEEISKERLASIESIQKVKAELMQEIKKKDDEVALCQAKVNQLKDNLSVEESKNIELAGKVEEISKERLASIESMKKLKVEFAQQIDTFHNKDRENQLLQWNVEKTKDELWQAREEIARLTDLLCVLQDQCDKKDQGLSDLHCSYDEAMAKYDALKKVNEDVIKATTDNVIELLDDIRLRFGWSEFDEGEGRHCITSSSQIQDIDPDNIICKYMTDLRVAVGRVTGSLLAYQDQNEILEREVEAKHDMIRELELLIGPFREQLEFFEVERKALTDVTSKTKKELEEIALQQAACLGHQNHKQKIRYLVQLKEANLKLKDEVNDLQAKLRHKDRTIWRLSKESLIHVSTPRGFSVKGKENSGKKTE